ncbi:AAA family ATPase [Nitriliruptoraceae bacterium ZYF776]|nr:AAA family ATPase [Profundirhabdus halotolerans]
MTGAADRSEPAAGGAPDPAAAAPGAKRRALAAEQEHVARVHDRVEELRARADARSASAAAERGGSTFQAVFERDVTAHHHASRAARLTFGDVESLAFGRLDLAAGDTLHVGRLSVIDEAGDVLLVDWRAPAAGAFYRATAAHPEGVARRRTLTTRGRRVDDLDDEVLDADAAEALGLQAVTGQGALLAALSRTRTGHLRDIVATIQADQDRIIRAPATGTLVIAGGPGTGKTVVALHRVAYLLYADRERFEGRGVLVIGPSKAFTEHTSRVLPSLGEDRAVQRSLAGLAPSGAEVDGWDDPHVAAIKGDLGFVAICRRLVRAAVPPLPPTTRFSFLGTSVEVAARTLAKVRRRHLDRIEPDRPGSSYHARTAGAEEALRAALWKAWRAAHRASGGEPPDERGETDFDEALEEAAQVTMLGRCWWPALDPVEVVARLVEGDIDLARVAADDLDGEAQQRLRDAWDAAEIWSVDDVAVLDEVAALLGPPPATRASRSVDGPGEGIQLTSDRLRVAVETVDVAAADYRDFAHVVVDEAQDLSPLQWRAVARRGPYASWTVVGDLAQRSRTAEPSTWDAVAKLIGRREVTVTRLDVNYRTPTEIVAVARAVLEAAGHDLAAVPRSVRSTGERPQLHRTDDPAGRAAAVVAERLATREGTVALLAPRSRLAELAGVVDAVVTDPVDRADRVAVLDPRTAKGLEFDDVVVVAPDAIAAETAVGLHQLYVAVTRATRSLALVAAPDAEVPGADACEVRR